MKKCNCCIDCLTRGRQKIRLFFQLFKNVLQLLGQRAFLDGVLALPGVFQAGAVQEQSVQSVLFLEFSIQGKISVAGVSQERVPDTGEVSSDLMHAARF